MKRFTCDNCGNEVHFESTTCVSCGYQLAYEPESRKMRASADGTYADGHVACANRQQIDCNWLLSDSDEETLCAACRHNNTIPDLSVAGNVDNWREMERAKRFLFYSLMRWDLPRPTLKDTDQGALYFEFKADEQNADGTVTPVLTGHTDGCITINIAEGNDAERESRRLSMGEPYRTLIGHFRHEIGHYYWDRLVRDRGNVDACREIFGDESEDYGQALQRHYENGAPADWQNRFISTYATSHAWEDFAETWAHYIHIVDALETARAFGMNLDKAVAGEDETEIDFAPYAAKSVRDLLEAWVPLTVAVNAINRSIGQPDLYPFVLNDEVEKKLGFIHDLIRGDIGEAQRAAA